VLDRSLAEGPDLAQIGLPAAFGMVVGVADVMAHYGALAADVTHIGHDSSSSNFLII